MNLFMVSVCDCLMSAVCHVHPFVLWNHSFPCIC